MYGGYLWVNRRVRGLRTGGVESAQPGVGVRLLGWGGSRAWRVGMGMGMGMGVLAGVDAHVLVESGRR